MASQRAETGMEGKFAACDSLRVYREHKGDFRQ